jgi:hypothetical protein
LVACSSPTVRDYSSESGAAAILLVDGVDAREAEMLVTAYFIRYEGACGGSSPVVRIGGEWTADIRVGYGGTPGQKIRVDCISGIVRQNGHPACRPPWAAIAEYIITPEQAKRQSTGVLDPFGT